MAILLKRINKEKFDEEDAFWIKILPDKGKDKGNINRIKNRLLKTLERFIALTAVERDEPLKTTLIASIYLERRDKTNTLSCINKAQRLADKPISRNLNNEIVKYWLHDLAAYNEKNNRVVTDHLDLMESALKEFYHINLMRLFCERANRKIIVSPHANPPIDPKRISAKSSSAEAKLYYHVYKMISSQSLDSYQLVTDFLQKNSGFFSPKLQKEFIEYLMNFCIRRINEGNEGFAKAYLEYVRALEKLDLLLDGGYIGIPRFKNCVAASIISGQMDWIKAFLEKYTDSLEESKRISREPFLNFNLAVIELHAGKLSESFQHLQDFQHSDMYLKDVYYKVASDKTLLKIFYQQEEIKAVKRRIAGIVKYIKINKKLTPVKKSQNLNFLDALQHLVSDKKETPDINAKELLLLDYYWLSKVIDR